MKKLFSWLAGRAWYVSVPMVIVAGIAAYLLISNGLHWLNSTGFCGKTCHVMTPEYTAYQTSFHSRVGCSECHVGPGLAAEIRAKAQGTKELWLFVTNTYERPIPSPVESLRPARETCEECHWPELFYEDRAVEIPHFSDDAFNTRTDTYLLIKIGGGTIRKGQGREIHWHIENPVEYIAVDEQRQIIPWVRAELDGKSVVFQDPVHPLSTEELEAAEIRTMDCIDCHNRATHVFRSSEVAVDEAMANGIIPTDLPFLKKKAVETMNREYPDQDAAIAAIDAIAGFYRDTFAVVYSKREDDILQTVEILKDIYRLSHFPEYRVYPGTYPDNLGHTESAGCFRCHDGKHLAEDGTSVRLHCNICHTIPETVAEGEPAPAVSFKDARQPGNHLASNWMADHRYILDASCAACHSMSSFCSNSNCHGRSWPYVNLEVIDPPFPVRTPDQAKEKPREVPDSPIAAADAARGPAAPAEQVEEPRISFTSQIKPMLAGTCAATCHSSTAAVGGFIADNYGGVVKFVSAGDPETSKLVQIQRAEHPAKLSGENLATISKWIEQGATEN